MIRGLITIAMALACSAAQGKSPNRAPTQDPFPAFPGTPGTSAPSTPAAGLISDEIFPSGGNTRINSVHCLFGGSSGYSLSGASGNDVKITRVTAGGDIRYEVYKGTKLIGACPSIHVSSN